MSGAPTSRSDVRRGRTRDRLRGASPGRRSAHSSRESNDSPRRAGKPPTGRRGTGDWISDHREVCVMQSAETVLDILRERGRRGLPLDELYRQMFNPQLYLVAYGRLYSNKGALTPGPDAENADGMTLAKIGSLIDALRHERYQFKPVKRTYIPKKNGRRRPLGLPSWSDKLVAEVARMLLEAYYEPQFSDCSHGVRPGRGCHTALRQVAVAWTGTTWFIEGDISGCFDRLDRQVMLY